MRKLFVLMIILSSGSVLAGDWEDLLFVDAQQIEIENLEDFSLNEISTKKNRVMNPCEPPSTQVCVSWRLRTSSPLQESEAIAAIEDAMNIWVQDAQLPIQFIYQGLADQNLNDDGEIIPDEEFIFSFEASNEWSFSPNELSRSLKEIDFDDSEEILNIRRASVYLNPLFNPLAGCTQNCLRVGGFESYSVRSVLVFEIGRMLGLGPSGLAHSVMHPVQVRSAKRYDFLREDDRNWIRSLYSLPVSNSGRLSGRVIDGSNGRNWSGAHVILLPASSAEAFADTLDANLFRQSSFTDRGGRFEFPSVPEGDYIILAEALDGNSLSPFLFDNAIQAFGSSDSFEPDFYDGGGRESNMELVRYSPRAILFAAIVKVEKSEETSGIEIITNQFGDLDEILVAQGSTNEVLSEFIPEDLEERIQSQVEEEISSASKGCELNLNENSEIPGWAFWFTLSMLFLLSRYRCLLRQQDLPKE